MSLIYKIISSLIVTTMLLVGIFTNSALSKFPNQPVVIVVPTGIGGGMDIMSRNQKALMEEALGVPVIIDNRPGGGTVNGYRHFWSRPHDGHTLYTLWTAGTIVHLVSGRRDADMGNMRGLGIVGIENTGIVVKGDSPWNSIKDMINSAKNGVVKGSGPSGASTAFLVQAMLGNAANVKFTYVPFSGSGEAMANLMGGHVDFGVLEPSEVWSQLQSGKLKYLAVASSKRLPFLPKIETFKENGYNVTFENIRGYLVHNDVPDDRVKVLAEAVKKGYYADPWQKFLNDNYFTKVYLGPEEATNMIMDYRKKLGILVKELGLEK
jgi:tripartite-type tricarboxylate transporter receptor subunit TctC